MVTASSMDDTLTIGMGSDHPPTGNHHAAWPTLPGKRAIADGILIRWRRGCPARPHQSSSAVTLFEAQTIPPLARKT